MRIIALDPGYDRCGIAVLERNKQGVETLLASDCFTTNKDDDFEIRLHEVIVQFRSWIREYQPTVCALESLFFTKNQKTAMRVAEVRGALLVTAVDHNLPIHEYGPNEIKVAIAGDGRATKDQVTSMVHRLIKITKEIQYDDEYDAVAIALTASAILRT